MFLEQAVSFSAQVVDIELFVPLIRDMLLQETVVNACNASNSK